MRWLASLFSPPLSESGGGQTDRCTASGGPCLSTFISSGLAKDEFGHEDKMESSNEGVYDRPGREDL